MHFIAVVVYLFMKPPNNDQPLSENVFWKGTSEKWHWKCTFNSENTTLSLVSYLVQQINSLHRDMNHWLHWQGCHGCNLNQLFPHLINILTLGNLRLTGWKLMPVGQTATPKDLRINSINLTLSWLHHIFVPELMVLLHCDWLISHLH